MYIVFFVVVSNISLSLSYQNGIYSIYVFGWRCEYMIKLFVFLNGSIPENVKTFNGILLFLYIRHALC